MSRAKTSEEVRTEFLDTVKWLSSYWAALPDKTAQERCDGLAFSMLVIFDGGSAGLPSIDLTLHPHHADTQYHQDNDENWYAPGLVINDCQLHELYVLIPPAKEQAE